MFIVPLMKNFNQVRRDKGDRETWFNDTTKIQSEKLRIVENFIGRMAQFFQEIHCRKK